MRVLVFGSTGGTGRELVRQALDLGHSVTAYVRDPSKIQDLEHPSLKVVRGDVLDPVVVEGAVGGQHCAKMGHGTSLRPWRRAASNVSSANPL